MRIHRKLGLGAAVVAVGALAGAAATTPASASPSDAHTFTYTAALAPVPTNHVTGSGTATITLRGNVATVDITATGLFDSVHAQHIHIDGTGQCPTAADAGQHNGNTAISTVDGQPAYGMIGTSLTTSGGTSAADGLAVQRFPSGSSFTYERTFKLSGKTVGAIRSGSAVVVVHGIDYNGNGAYDFDALGASQLDPSLPLEATAPALCGALG